MAEEENKAPTTAEEPAPTEAPKAAEPAPEAPKAEPHEKKPKKPKADAARLAAAEQKADEAAAECARLKDQFLRTSAEYDNFRKRSQKEHDAAFSNGVAHAAETLLPVLDTLEAAASVPTADEDYKKGVLLTLNKAKEVFAKMGIAEIDACGQPFDPELHNACMQEAVESAESGCVTRVMQKGYTLNGRVVRHAVVAVAP